jgi:POT family proton-dependent oligopeptide transporter
MGVNAGAFFGILLCGYLGEKVGWTYGFGLAGIFMFWNVTVLVVSKHLWNIGLKPNKRKSKSRSFGYR